MDLDRTLRELGRRQVLAQRRLEAAMSERDRRESDALRIYQPQPLQDAFHRSKAPIRILRGGNRSGKSLAAFVELARAIRRCDPYGKYPTDRPLTIWTIAYEEDNIGRTFYRLLFTSVNGPFKCIKDRITGKVRPWSPSLKEDLDRKSERFNSPPLVPIKECGVKFYFKKKGQQVFKVARLPDGTSITSFCSGSKPPQGDPVDIVLIDEDLKHDRNMITELQARLADEGGCLIWSVWPHTTNDALRKLSRLAADQRGMEQPDVEEFLLSFSGNVYLPAENKARTLRGWAAQGEDVLRSRDKGEFLLDTVLMYPEYAVEAHGAPNVQNPACLDRNTYQTNFDWFLRTRKVPDDWTRFMWVDPGYGCTAVLFLACPPSDLGDYVLAYDELYLRNCTAERFGEEVARKVWSGGQPIYAFGIDMQQGQKHEQGTGKRIWQQFSEQLKKRNIRSVTTGSGFRRGSTDVSGRCAMVRSWLAGREDGTPKFRVLRSKSDDGLTALPEMDNEFHLYRRRLVHEEAREEPVAEHNHLMNCLEMAAHDPITRYQGARHAAGTTDPVAALVRTWLDEENRQHGGDYVHLGPGKGLSSQTR